MQSQIFARNPGGRHPRTRPPRSPRRGECWAARGGEVWVSLAELPKRGTRLSTRFLELGDADRQGPANPPPALPTAWGVLGSPRGACPGRFDRVPETGPVLADPFLQLAGAHRPTPANPSPRSPRRGECGGARLGTVWSRMAELPKRAPTSPARFLQLGDSARQAPAPALPTAWGARGGPFGARLGQDGLWTLERSLSSRSR